MTQVVKPVIMTGKNRTEHTFFMRVWQDIPSYVNKQGNIVPEHKAEMSFETVTKENVYNDNLSNWACENLFTWMVKNKVNGKAKQNFKLSKEINVEFSIDDKVVKDTMKFSLSAERMTLNSAKLTTLVSLLFRKHTPIHKAVEATTIRFVEETSRILLVSKIDRKQPALPAASEEINQPVVEKVGE